MKPQLKLGLACIVVALVLMVAACTPAKAEEDMKPGAICTTEQARNAELNFAFNKGKAIGHQLGGQAAVDELLGHFEAMCTMYQNAPDEAGLSAPMVELRNGIRIQCAK